MKATHTGWGFDTKAMDLSVRPQDDFYQYANGNWLKKSKIPAEEARWGSFNILRHETEKQLLALVEKMKKVLTAKGSSEQLVRDMYTAGMDMKARNALGLKPIIPYLKKIDAIKDQKSLTKVLGELHVLGITVPWGYAVDQDSKNSSKYVLHFYQSGLGLPDREYYLEDEPEYLRVRKAYTPFIVKMHRLLGLSQKDATSASKTILKIETALARLSMKKEDTRDAEKTYHKFSLAEFKKFGGIAWSDFLKAARIPTVPYIIVTQPEFVRGAAKLITELSIEDMKTYLRWHLFLDSAPYLSDSIIKTNFEFYGRVLMGQKVMRPLWRRVLGTVNGSVGFALGRIYIEKHFTHEAKKKMNELVNDLFEAYEARMHALDWMSPATKKKAIYKLRAVSRKIGYPTKWKSYAGLLLKPNDFFGNVLRSGEHGRKRELAKLKKKIDRSEWHMTPQTVNAYCNFNLNEIVFPAAMLQHPFFSLTADAAINYGAIGSVIGHELTHAFDDQGSKFDAVGNMKRWWTDSDRKHFEKKAKILVDQYSAFTVADGVHVNGQLTLGENIADLGGAVIAYDAHQRHILKHGRHDIDGFTPEQRFFLGFAQQEQELTRPEFAKTAAKTDPHSPAPTRINGPLVHVDGFYTAFNVKKGDKLFRDPKTRAYIW